MHSSTKRIARSVLLALVLLGVASAPAQAQFGVSAGADFDSVDDIRAEGEDVSTLESATGYHLGAVYEFGLGPINLRPGLFYRKVGSFDFPDTEEFDVTAVEVPVDVRFTVIPFPLVSGYVLGGPKAVFPQSEGEFEDNALEDISYTFDVGVGANVSVPGVALTLQPELRYEFGATDYIGEDFEIGDTSFQPSDSERKLSAFALRLNVLF